MTLPFHVDRTLVIQASPAIVFGFLSETPRWAAWWGAGSEIDPRPGGRMKIVYPGGREVTGEVLEVAPPQRIVFTYGFTDGEMIPPGGSRVTIDLEPIGAATRLLLRHDVADERTRDAHIQGWRYQLSLFANAVSDTVNAGAGSIVDSWFDAWADPNASSRERALSLIAGPALSFYDRFSNTSGDSGSCGPHHSRSAFHAGHADAPEGRCATLSGNGDRRLRRAIRRRSGTRKRYERFCVWRGRAPRARHRIHDDGVAVEDVTEGGARCRQPTVYDQRRRRRVLRRAQGSR